MKKIIKYLLIIFVLIGAVGCTLIDEPTNNDDNELVIYSMNDFHGALFEEGEEVGISKISNFLKAQKKAKPDRVLILSAGDMFQGTAVSSLTKGKVVVEAMNEIGFDAMALGNHEFDWGIDDIVKFHDDNLENGEANFPFISSNIIETATEKPVDWVEPYAVIEKGNLRIGVIGTLGEDQKSDILASIVAPYTFDSQITAIKKYAKELRTVENCDIVIAVSHSDTKIYNEMISELEGDEKVDAVINGHTHRYYASEEGRINDAPMPVIQSGNNGVYIGKITLTLDPKTKDVVDSSAEYIKMSNVAKTKDSKMDELLSKYQNEINISNEVLGSAGEYINRNDGTIWAANVIQDYAKTDFGFVNGGGIRAVGFPIDANQTVTYGSIFKIMPFDNLVNIVSLTGAQVKEAYSRSNGDLKYNKEFNPYNNTLNGKLIEDDEYYTVATIDYVFEKTYYPFLDGKDIIKTEILFRDYLIQAVKDSAQINGKWYLNR